METRIVLIPTKEPLGSFDQSAPAKLDRWEVRVGDAEALAALQKAGAYLKEQDIPVAFPTETVYGLGADATRSSAVKGIYAAKGRPSDNPLIVHVSDLDMLRGLLRPGQSPQTLATDQEDIIPRRYRALVDKFWPGPLTILLPNPTASRLAPEVTAGLPTFGVRMPSSSLALSLIKLAGVPIAAPSANASTKPSPTAAQHVKYDLDGRIELILDGGPCQVGVESTVVDGLCDPPVVLRPGGVGIDEIRKCPGWENVTKAYKDQSEVGKSTPRAPGMKYKHYSPRARVVLYEYCYGPGANGIMDGDRRLITPTSSNGHLEHQDKRPTNVIGVVRTRRWQFGAGLKYGALRQTPHIPGQTEENGTLFRVTMGDLVDEQAGSVGTLLDIDLGSDVRGIAQGLFSALRELDQRGADVIFVDGIDDQVDIAAAVMNRLRKAASEIRT